LPQVFSPAGDEVIDPDDLISFRYKTVTKMGADKARGARNQIAHEIPPPGFGKLLNWIIQLLQRTAF
jgi:hypothetical protein